MARAAKTDVAEAAAVAEVAEAHTTKATGAMPMTGVEKASGDNSNSNGAHSILRIKGKEKETGVAKVDLRLQSGVVRGRPSRAARLVVSFPLAGRQKFRSTGLARRRRTLSDVTMMRLTVLLHA